MDFGQRGQPKLFFILPFITFEFTRGAFELELLERCFELCDLMILYSNFECFKTSYDVTRAYFDDEVTWCYSYDFGYHKLSYFGIKFVSR